MYKQHIYIDRTGMYICTYTHITTFDYYIINTDAAVAADAFILFSLIARS
jgi:hypothetical protein